MQTPLKTPVQTLATILRNWQAAQFATSSAQADTLLQAANTMAMEAHSQNTAHIGYTMLAIFTLIETDQLPTAGGLLKKVFAYKSFYKNRAEYGLLCFLYALWALLQNKKRTAKKYWRQIQDPILQGLLHLENDDLPQAFDLLSTAMENGNRSLFMYMGLYRYYKLTSDQPQNSSILTLLNYISAKGGDITGIAKYHHQALYNALKADPAQVTPLYHNSGYLPLPQHMPFPLALQVYHHAIHHPTYTNALTPHHPHILATAQQAQEQNLQSPQANTLYCYAFTTGHATPAMEALLWQNLHTWEIDLTHSTATDIYITQVEKKATTAIKIEGDILAIQSATFPSYITLNHRTLLDETLPITRRVQNAPEALYQHFYNQGKNSFYLLVSLNTPAAYEALLTHPETDPNYHSTLLAKLGHAHYPSPKALEYFKKIPPQHFANTVLTHPSPEFFEFILGHFPLTYQQLTNLTHTTPTLDIHLLQQATAEAIIDRTAQDAFTRVANHSPESQAIPPFINLLCTHLFANPPNLTCLSPLESYAPSHPILAIALATSYLTHHINTQQSQGIISQAIKTLQDMNTLPPIFKQRPGISTPFIEKHQAFMHQGTPGQALHMYYRLGHTGEYSPLPMKEIHPGIYTAILPLFYTQQLSYYFTHPGEAMTIQNTSPFIQEDTLDPYFAINNAIIYQRLFKYQPMEANLAKLAPGDYGELI